MKDFFTPMKIPQKWVCLLAMSFVFGQQAFSSENYVTESIAVSADIMQQKSKTVVGTVTDNGEPIIGASVVVKNAGKGVITDMDGNFKLMFLLVRQLSYLMSDMIVKKLFIRASLL